MNSDKQLSHQQLLIQRNNKITSKINTQMIIDILNNDNNKTYHIRNITKGIADKYPDFNNLSISKQRRVIMNILENNKNIFEKVGWGLWKLINSQDKPTENIIKPINNNTQNIMSNNVVKIKKRSSISNIPNDQIHPKHLFKQDNGFIMPLNNQKHRKDSISKLHQSYNENALISSEDEDNNNGTDEEDWKTLGAENLLINQRRKSYGGIIKIQSRKNSTVEENAAMLLVQLRRGSQ
ncbi:uncharacterized protein HGUI_04069 [Hanseniaspora guilliermondii]|uniref:Uncharacterized protein n=1 Tax=Hanseniaspora guilliermondii TaxID=56406 RepID=A0A1L0B7Q8_9ASCO|nr:uncharacterized protein HGUI_04069 [Hanseniaspora guilliermondii]